MYANRNNRTGELHDEMNRHNSKALCCLNYLADKISPRLSRVLEDYQGLSLSDCLLVLELTVIFHDLGKYSLVFQRRLRKTAAGQTVTHEQISSLFILYLMKQLLSPRWGRLGTERTPGKPSAKKAYRILLLVFQNISQHHNRRTLIKGESLVYRPGDGMLKMRNDKLDDFFDAFPRFKKEYFFKFEEDADSHQLLIEDDTFELMHKSRILRENKNGNETNN